MTPQRLEPTIGILKYRLEIRDSQGQLVKIITFDSRRIPEIFIEYPDGRIEGESLCS